MFNGGRVWITSRNDGDLCCNVMMPINTMEYFSTLIYVILMYLDDVFIVVACILPIATNSTYAPSNRHHTSYASYYNQGLGYCNIQGVNPSSLVVKSIKAIFSEMFYLEFHSPLLALYEIKSALCSLVFHFRHFSKFFTSRPSKKS